jgi:hypothetical protein
VNKPIAIPEPKKKSAPDVWAQASQLARRLARLDDAEQQEIAQSPASIRAKFEAKRQAAMAEAEPEVLEIVKRMRATEAAQ